MEFVSRCTLNEQTSVAKPMQSTEPSTSPGLRGAVLRRPWLMALLLLAIVILFYWRLTLTSQYTWISNPDAATQVVPWFQEEARQWHQGKFPLWDPHLWMGQPFLAQAQPGAAYPLNWLLFSLPLRDGQLPLGYLKWYYIVIHFMGAAFAYWLCRDMGRSRIASLIGACLFSFGAYLGFIDWPQMANGAVWTPLVLMFLLRAVRGVMPWFSAAATGGALGIAWLSGHHQIPIFASVLVLGLWLFFALRGGRWNWRIAQFACVCFLFAALVGALQILPSMEYGRLAERWVGAPSPVTWRQSVPYDVHERYSLTARSLPGILLPGFGEGIDLYIGMVCFCLAFAAIALAWRDARVRLFGGITLASLVFALGPRTPFHGILYGAIPWLDKARTPSMAILFVQLGIVVLAAYGADLWADSGIQSPWRRNIIAGAAVFGGFVLTVCLVEALAGRLTADDRIPAAAFFALLVAALLSAWKDGRLGPRQALCLLVLLVLVELGNNAGGHFIHRDSPQANAFLDKVRGNRDVAQFLRAQPQPLRIEIDTDKMMPNFGDWYGIDAVEGYLAGVTTNLVRMDFAYHRTHMLFGANYTLTYNPPRAGQQEVLRGASGIIVYRNADAFPRVWTVHKAVPVTTPYQINWYLHNADFDLRNTALITPPVPPLAPCDGSADRANLLRNESDQITIDANMSCDGMVIVSETWFPGWKVTVDGVPHRMFETYGALRGVLVPRGHHTIEMRYRPASVFAGAAATGTGCVGLVLLFLFERRRSARAQAA